MIILEKGQEKFTFSVALHFLLKCNLCQKPDPAQAFVAKEEGERSEKHIFGFHEEQKAKQT